MEKTQLLSISEYAIRTQTPEATVRYNLKQGKLKGVKLGKFWYVSVPKQDSQNDGNAVVLTLFTHAGGAGKTSLARDLGFQLASEGKRVLLIDADPQANLSTWLGCAHAKNEDTLLNVIENYQLPKPQVITIGSLTLEIIPANLSLALAEIKIPSRSLGMFCLRSALNPIQNQWDYILIDSLPSLGSIAGMAALAGNGLIVPVETSEKGLQALQSVLSIVKDYENSLQAFQQWHPHRTFVRLIVPTKYDSRTRSDQEAQYKLNTLAQTAAIPITPPISYRPSPYKEAIRQQIPIQLVHNQESFDEIQQVASALQLALEVQ